MDLRLDVYVKRKKAEGGYNLDRRRYREIRNNKERLLEKLKLDLDLLGIVTNKDDILLDFLKIKNFETINFPLMIIVYDYFSKKLFDMENVTQDFDNDFKQIIKEVKEKAIFNLDRKGVIYRFRQDFIVYLLILYRDLVDNEEVEEYEPEEIDEEYIGNRGEDINYQKLESLRDETEYMEEENNDDEYFNEI